MLGHLEWLFPIYFYSRHRREPSRRSEVRLTAISVFLLWLGSATYEVGVNVRSCGEFGIVAGREEVVRGGASSEARQSRRMVISADTTWLCLRRQPLVSA